MFMATYNREPSEEDIKRWETSPITPAYDAMLRNYGYQPVTTDMVEGMFRQGAQPQGGGAPAMPAAGGGIPAPAPVSGANQERVNKWMDYANQ
jgi:hypothetical protein